MPFLITLSIDLQARAPGLFSIWMLRDNTQHSKAPNCWVDVLLSYHNMKASDAPLHQHEAFWNSLVASQKDESNLKKILQSPCHSMKLLKIMITLSKIPCWRDVKAPSFIGRLAHGGMHNVSKA